MQFCPNEVQGAFSWHRGFNPLYRLGLYARLTLTITCTLRNCLFLTQASSRFVLHALFGLDVGGNQISSVYDLSQTSGNQDMRSAGTYRSLIEQLSRNWH